MEEELAELASRIEELEQRMQIADLNRSEDPIHPSLASWPLPQLCGPYTRPFEIEGDKLTHCYYSIEQRMYKMDDVEIADEWDGKILYLCIDLSEGTAEVKAVEEISDYNADADDESKSVTPLWIYDAADDSIDLRGLPHMQQWGWEIGDEESSDEQ